MNFLAHVYLSGRNEELLVGNFIADFVKGKNALAFFHGDIKEGIILHRAIDAFTDTHEVVAESKRRLREKYRHYAGVIVDVFYDHFLARNWQSYHGDKLQDFAPYVYSVIEKHHDMLPEKVKEFFPYMVRGNWLVNYARIEGIGRTLSGMSRRTPYESRMDEAVNDLVRSYDIFKTEFELFFPQLREHVGGLLRGSRAQT